MPNILSKDFSQKDTRGRLKELLKPGDTVYCITRHVSKSGMSRRVSFFVVTKKTHALYCIDYLMAEATGHKRSKQHEGLVIGGCGMDMHFAAVYSLGRFMFPKGFKLRKGQHGRNGDTSGYDKDGGYALGKVSL